MFVCLSAAAQIVLAFKAGGAVSSLGSGPIVNDSVNSLLRDARGALLVAIVTYLPITFALASIIYPHASLEYLFTLFDVVLGVFLIWYILYKLALRSDRAKQYEVSSENPGSVLTSVTSSRVSTPASSQGRNADFVKIAHNNAGNGAGLSSFGEAYSGGPDSWASPRNVQSEPRHRISSGAEFDDLIAVLKLSDNTNERQLGMPDELLYRQDATQSSGNKRNAPFFADIVDASESDDASAVQPAERVRSIFATPKSGSGRARAAGQPGLERVPTVTFSLPSLDELDDAETDPDERDLSIATQQIDESIDEEVARPLRTGSHSIMRRVSIADTHL